MSDEGEKTCPLCAEEMDYTDQQLKPCKCGYEICVWCWHHIMDMAEKEDTEGRCPACRMPYDKEKIVGTAANCERLVAEINMERKAKSQKSKGKTSEGRKQLSSVRVIQRNLVYIVGLPLNLADEELLQRREYFGQYGKVLKVSMSRTAAGVIQQFPNNTCSVYITYSKEEEAIRCIQNVHGFVLEGRSLRACFGTTKYCHAWLRNVPCTNPDCLYLHEIGSQEDSFTKDEIISAYTRVQQITGAANNVQRRSGNVLPPPLDDCWNSSSGSSGKPIVKNGSTNSGSIIKGSPPNGSSGRSIALPAAASWGTRGSNCQPPVANFTCSNGSSKQKPDTVSGTLAFSSAVAGTTQASILHSDGGKMPSMIEASQYVHTKVNQESVKPVKELSLDCQTNLSEKPPSFDGASAAINLRNQFSCSSISKDDDRGINMAANISNATDLDGQSCTSVHEIEQTGASDDLVQKLCSQVSSLSIDGNGMDEHAGITRLSNSISDHSIIKSPQNQDLQQYYAEQSRDPSSITQKTATSTSGVYISRDKCEWLSDSQTQAVPNIFPELEEDIISFDNQRLKDPEVVSHSTYLPNSVNVLHSSNHFRSPSQQSESYGVANMSADRLYMDSKVRDGSILSASSVSAPPNGYARNLVASSACSDRTLENTLMLPDDGCGRNIGRFVGDAADIEIDAVVDKKGESSIISNILSLDFDSWDESLTSPQNLAKLLGDNDKQTGSHKISSSWKPQTNSQSRFSFARQEESMNQVFDVQPSLNAFSQVSSNHPFSRDLAETRDLYSDKLGIGNGFLSSNFEESEIHASNHSAFSSSKLSAVSRAQISAPPGFSVPNRAPPPGFASHERVDQAFDALAGNRLLDATMLRNAYQLQATANMVNTADIEFMDPAILAVGKGRLQGGLNGPPLEIRSNFPSQLSPFENDARLQLLMQRSLPSQQNLRFPDFGDNYSHLSDSYGISSRLVDQSPVNSLSPFAQMSLQQSRNGMMSNGHWEGWNEVQGGNTLGVAELMRNERLGFNKFYAGYEDSKFRMPSSGDLYNRNFGM